MAEKNSQFHFEFSLQILNNLGRGLYRSFATVIAEAVSNSWDAEATIVNVTIKDNILIVEDNGKGMDGEDFQNKFLKIGYSRRKDPENQSKRNVIGRKGIGKLAMLSISKKVTILSKKDGKEITGGKINNTILDEEIEKDGNYVLENLSDDEKEKLFSKDKINSGTKIIFEDIKTSLNREGIIKKYLATQFNFIFSLKGNDRFKIMVNDKEVTEKDLKELNDNTQFIWFLAEENKGRKNRYNNLKKHKIIQDTTFKFEQENIEIKGFIASVKKPTHLLLRGSGGDFKASINLFCNGRLRQGNLFEEITSKTVTEEYLYGEVHVDGFEDEIIDRFTSSREGVIKDDPLYQKFLKELKKIQSVILKDWNGWRREEKADGDIEQDSRPGYEVKIEESTNRRIKEFIKKISENLEDEAIKDNLKEKLKSLSYKNMMTYQDFFILENIFREYIKIKDIKEEDFDENEEDEKLIAESIRNVRNLRKIDEERHALKGKIVKEEHYLNYLDLFYLGEIIDIKILKIPEQLKKYRKPLELDTKEISPVRNSIMHTNEISEEAFNWEKIKNVINYIEKLKNES